MRSWNTVRTELSAASRHVSESRIPATRVASSRAIVSVTTSAPIVTGTLRINSSPTRAEIQVLSRGRSIAAWRTATSSRPRLVR